MGEGRVEEVGDETRAVVHVEVAENRELGTSEGQLNRLRRKLSFPLSYNKGSKSKFVLTTRTPRSNLRTRPRKYKIYHQHP